MATSPPRAAAAATAAEPSSRRHHSELDMSSLRRISEALLLAQNRARLATERANRSERALRLVLTQVNPQLALSLRHQLASQGSHGGALGDTMEEDWDLMHSVTQEQAAPAALLLPPPRHYSLDVSSHSSNSGDAAESDTALWASVVAPEERTGDVALLAKEIVENLRAAAVRGDQRVQKLNAAMPSGATFRSRRPQAADARGGRRRESATPEKNWLETWKHRLFRIEVYALTPLQFVAGILVGVVVGMTVTKQLMLRRPGGGASQLAKRLAACAERHPRASDTRQAAALRFLPFGAMDEDLSRYYVHPTAVEVA